MEQRHPLIIISGPPGAGKTTIAKELRELAAEPTAYIEGDTFWKYFPYKKPGDRKKGDFRVIMRAMLQTAASYAASYPVILDFSIPPWYLEGIRKIAVKRGIPTHYVLILPPEEVCAERAANRTEGAIEDYGGFHDFYVSFTEAEGAVLKDDLSVEETVVKIQTGIENGIFMLSAPQSLS